MNEQSIFNEALDRGDPAVRSAYLDEACAGDLALRERVETLLTSHAAAGNFLGKLAPERIAEELKCQQPDDETQGESSEENKSSEADLGFLTPSDKPGVLGRLGHYEVLEVIGQGGMGIVLRAFDDKLHRVVAIKVMATALAATSPPRKRFLREARAAAKVRHEHVVDIHAVEDQPTPYLVMEYVSGETLQQKLDRVGPLETPEVLRLGQQIARGLAAAHAQGLIHRDIKPSNILLEKGADERVKITDFGLARAADDVSLTQSGMIAGTPMYMAPEQTLGEANDHRADLFSLGSVLYTMCSGRPPFRATTSMATLKRVAEDQPRPIREIIPEVPQWLCDIIAKLHAKKAEERFQSATEVADLLGQCIQHLEHPTSGPLPASVIPLSALGSGAEGEGQPQPATTTPVDGSGRATRRHRRLAVAAAVLLLVLGGFTLTEATGVTNLRATVIRIFTPEGTLVVETDDPAVKVTVEGDGDLVITGAGPQEVRLRAGSYRLKATRDGKPVKLDRDLVTITRGDRQLVRVRLEDEPPAAVVPKAEQGAFVVLTGKGIEVRKFDTLAEAVQGASGGDAIEIRGNGPFVCGPVKLTHALTIRAAEGFRPVLQFAENLRTDAPLVLEGLELQRVGQKVPQGDGYAIVLAWGSPSLHIVNCRFREHLMLPCVRSNAPICVLRNCEFLSPLHRAANLAGKQCIIDNSLAAGWGMLQLAFDVQPNQPDISVQISRSSLRTSEHALLVQLYLVQPDKFAEKDAKRVRFDTSSTIFDTPLVVVMNEVEPFLARLKPQPEEAKALLLRMLTWRDRGNLYAPGGSLLLWNQPPEGVAREIGPRSLADWKKLWASGDADAIEGHVKYQGGDLLAKLRDAPEKLTPEDFRLRPDSAGYRAGKDGKDLGADVDLVGPGPAYERWKKTPDYQQWLKDSGQVKK
jgi:serine/threonine protein kinase